MMAVNRYRLKHRAQRGERGAKLAVTLLGQTDTLLGVILLGNNLINAAAATLTTVITVRLFGEGEFALAMGTVAVTFAILVFSEITPKVIGAAHADRIAPRRELRACADAQGGDAGRLVRQPVRPGRCCRLLRIKQAGEAGTTLSQEELRSLVLEGQYFRGKHRAMLANLLDLEAVTVDDVMTPRNQIHALDLADQAVADRAAARDVLPHAAARLRGSARQHRRRRAPEAGRAAAAAPGERRSGRAPARSCARRISFPPGTPLLAQLQQFQSDRERLGLVVDEYGELVGLVTIEDIIEEIIGDFTTAGARRDRDLPARAPTAAVVVDGLAPLRALNRRLGTALSAGWPEDPERAHRRATGRDSRGRHARRRRRPGDRDPADAGPWRQSRAPAPPGRAARPSRLYKAPDAQASSVG